MLKLKREIAFKTTEVGKIPKEWDTPRLEEFIDLKSGNYFRFSEFTRFGVKCLKIDNVSFGEISWDTVSFLPERYLDEFFDLVLKEDDIVIALNRPIINGQIKVARIKKRDCPSLLYQRVGKIAYKREGVDHNFLFFVFLSEYFKQQLWSSLVGTDQPYIRTPMFLNIKIPLPPFEEQKRIGSVLLWFDNLIENKRRQNEVLEGVAMAVFKSWFVDFEPFKDCEFVPSELGEIPKGWDVKPLIDIATLFKGVSYGSSEISAEHQGNLFITLNNFLRGGGFKSEYEYYIGSKAKEEQKVRGGDLIIALTDVTPQAKVVGAPAIVSLPYGYDFGVISLDCGKLQLRKECLRLYLYLYLKNTQEENSTFANGVNVLHLNTTLFMRNKLILVPPEPILKEFHSFAEPLFRKILLNQKQILILRKIRDTLLPLLVFGRLRVEEI